MSAPNDPFRIDVPMATFLENQQKARQNAIVIGDDHQHVVNKTSVFGDAGDTTFNIDYEITDDIQPYMRIDTSTGNVTTVPSRTAERIQTQLLSPAQFNDGVPDNVELIGQGVQFAPFVTADSTTFSYPDSFRLDTLVWEGSIQKTTSLAVIDTMRFDFYPNEWVLDANNLPIVDENGEFVYRPALGSAPAFSIDRTFQGPAGFLVGSQTTSGEVVLPIDSVFQTDPQESPGFSVFVFNESPLEDTISGVYLYFERLTDFTNFPPLQVTNWVESTGGIFSPSEETQLKTSWVLTSNGLGVQGNRMSQFIFFLPNPPQQPDTIYAAQHLEIDATITIDSADVEFVRPFEEYSTISTPELVEEHSLRFAGVSPNPVAVGQRVRLPYYVKTTQPVTVAILDLQGRELYSATYNLKAGAGHVMIPTENLSSGLHFVRTTNGVDMQTQRLLVK